MNVITRYLSIFLNGMPEQIINLVSISITSTLTIGLLLFPIILITKGIK